ncbi:2-(1,2-epoxy-1,2-dihydrophenyl)acetyl-CoA isomerase [Jatrophihabitans endophyticus]|uniref:2-(1,2-epoxy-1,2-dihydrophenyl)acetyl-CoA isomerase n=1 Tax=Jatrophihabitans endophyticus TaxID=1206085 RepID=A0A1M5PQQ1_9ACTN|nr:enoyl-CoA hydratase/isomerase family protein [Jatrophihabitans endophyticus]SHH03879.1 2-(1,2-epoxy-1,2-dihydrophenyl)acetyl-CoA isomerase [Jatrophihabitans endophyticus]
MSDRATNSATNSAIDSAESRIESRVRDGVLEVVLARPAARNAIDTALAVALREALSDTGGVGAVAVLARGEHFCVGGDVRAMAAAADPGTFVTGLAEQFHRSVVALAEGPPVVAGVRGWAAGAGLSLVLAADVVVATEQASFQPGYAGLGVTPDGGLSWSLPRAVGDRRARALLLSNRVVGAAEAQRIGIVDDLVADEELETTVLDVARRLAAGPRRAARATKRLVREGASRPLTAQLAVEAGLIGAHAAAADGQEGIAAFLARRAASFGG